MRSHISSFRKFRPSCPWSKVCWHLDCIVSSYKPSNKPNRLLYNATAMGPDYTNLLKLRKSSRMTSNFLVSRGKGSFGFWWRVWPNAVRGMIEPCGKYKLCVNPESNELKQPYEWNSAKWWGSFREHTQRVLLTRCSSCRSINCHKMKLIPHIK